MARRKSLLVQIQREMVRSSQQAQRAYATSQRDQVRLQRDADRAMRAAERAAAANDREAKRAWAEARAAQVDADNARLADRVDDLQGLLSATLTVDDFFDIQALRRSVEYPPFNPGALARPIPMPTWDSYAPPPPSGLSKMFGAKKHELTVASARGRFDAAAASAANQERVRQSRLAEYETQHKAAVAAIDAEVTAQNAEVDRFSTALASADPQAIVDYFDLVLSRSDYPDDFPQAYKLAYVPESKQLVVEYQLPALDVVPAVRSYRYVRIRDEVTAAARPAKDIKTLYTDVVTQTTLRTLHEIFEADRPGFVDSVVLNGVVHTTDPATGRAIQPCLVTVRTTREVFTGIDLGLVDPVACLTGLNASVSKRPDELAPVRPVLEFDMVDKRFIEETDVLSDLDRRPNLLELTPSEFESLIQNLFAKMGLDTKQTRASRDGGIDCVAFDPRPIFGGKVVIQAKRYRHTVDVSAVRDLFGSMQNEGASKGILVATSVYGPTAFEFASGKPLELIDGSNLLYLLQQHAGIEARIVVPEP